MAVLAFDDLADPAQPLSEDQATGAIQNLAPGATITSGFRTPQHNAEVKGVPNSLHTRGGGEAADIQLPASVSPDQFRSQLQAAGYPITEFLVEKAGDPHSTGPHVHWGWGPKSQTQPTGALTFDDLSHGTQPRQSGPMTFDDLAPGAAPGAPAQAAPAPPAPSWWDVMDPKHFALATFGRWKSGLLGLGQWMANQGPAEPPLAAGVSQEELYNDPRWGNTPEQQAQRAKAFAPLNKWFAQTQASIAQDVKANTPQTAPWSAQDIAYKVASGVADMAPALAATVATKSPLAGAAIIAGQAGGGQYADSIANGRTPDQAAMDASFSAATNGGLGALELKWLMKPGGTFLAKTLRSAGAGAFQSVATEALQIGYDWGIINPDMTLKDALGRMEQAGVVGTLSGAMLGGGHHAFESAVGRFRAMRPSASVQPGQEGAGAPRYAPNARDAAAMAATGLDKPGTPPGPSGSAAVVNLGGAGEALNPDGVPVSARGQAIPTPGGTRIAGRRGMNAGVETLIPGTDNSTSFSATPGRIAQDHAFEVATLEREGAERAATALPPARAANPGLPADEITREEFGHAPPPSPVAPARPAPEAAAPNGTGIPRRELESDTAITASGREVPVRYAVVEAAHLVPSQTPGGDQNPHYPAELQPRDRTRAVSQAQVASIAQNINPRLLDRSVNASDGAPIVSTGGVVESGNGRTMAIQRAYAQDMPSAQAYRDYLAAQGYPVDGMTAPVLVRVREGDMTPAERQSFVREANQSGQLGYSATERAMTDAAAMPEHVLDLYRGGEIEGVGNRDFVRSFMRSAVPANEHAGMIDSSGALSQQAIARVRGALLAKAYGDPDLVGRIIESPDTNIKAIGGALGDVAADWAKMRARAGEGQIPPALDQTGKLLEAVNLVAHARSEGRNVAEYVVQPDIFTGEGVDPDVESWLRLMFRNTKDWTQPVGREKLADALRFYANEAMKAQVGPDLLGAGPAAPGDMLAAARRKQGYGEQTAGSGPSLSFGEDLRTSGVQGAGRGAADAEAGRGQGAAETGPEGAVSQDLTAGEYAPQPKDFRFGGGPTIPAGPSRVTDLTGEFERFARDSTDIHAVANAAAQYVVSRGRQMGTEALVALGSNTASVTGNKPRAVSLSDAMDRALMDGRNRIVTVHNHPGSSSFSAGDIGLLALPGHAGAIVAAHDGNFYSVRLAARTKRSANEAQHALQRAHKRANEGVAAVFDQHVDRELPRAVANKLFYHAVNQALDAAGVTDYRSSIHVPDDIENIFAKAVQNAAKTAAQYIDRSSALQRDPARTDPAYRRAEPIRPQDGTGDLLARIGKLSGDPGTGRSAAPSPAVSRPVYRKPEQLKLLEDENRYEETRPPFYSALTRAVEESRMSRATAKDWLGFIDNLKNKGIKDEEVDWSGVREWLKGQTGPVTREQVAQHLRENEVQVQEVEKGDMKSRSGGKARMGELRPAMDEMVERHGLMGFDTRSEARRAIVAEPDGWDYDSPEDSRLAHEYSTATKAAGSDNTKFSSYVLPGGENYRELLLTMPEKAPELPNGYSVKPFQQGFAVFDDAGDEVAWSPTRGGALANAAPTIARKVQTSPTFRSGHWEEPNILAHIRFDDRTGPNGEKVLHVAEIQSDWHQQGRKVGYRDEKEIARLKEELTHAQRRGDADEASNLNHELQAQQNRPPPAPFKQSWHELAAKRMLRYAAEHGYDRLSWDTGQTAADRFDLSKRVSRIDAEKRSDGNYGVEIFGKDGQPIGYRKLYTPIELAEHVGKNVADKITNDLKESGSEKSYSGLDLKVGGEGMKGFYDRILPQFMSKYGKKWGAKVEASTTSAGFRHGAYVGPEIRIEGPAWDRLEFSVKDNATLSHQLSDVEDAIRRGSSFGEAMSAHGSPALAKRAGGDIPDESNAAPVHSVTITPAMRESVMGGQSMFEDKERYGTPPAMLHEGPTPGEKPKEDLKSALYRRAAPIRDMVEGAQMLISPMTAADTQSRATGFRFANMKRLSRDTFIEQDKLLQKKFTPKERKQMFRALDKASIAVQKGEPKPDIYAGMTDAQRMALDKIRADRDRAWKTAQDLGMVKSEGIPEYVPHLYVDVADGGAKTFGSGGKRVPSMGRNLTTTTSHLKHRKYLTKEEGAEALSVKTGRMATPIEDIRALPLATMKLRDAAIGRAFINDIGKYDLTTGGEGNSEGAVPDGYFTMEHPSFFTWRPKFITEKESGKIIAAKDQNGQPVFERVPIAVPKAYEGVLRAVLTEDSGKLYQGYMALKGKVMNNIMFSPLVQLHLLTELGRAFPANPIGVLTGKILFDGYAAKNDPEFRMHMIRHGLNPISHGGAFADITSMAQPDNLKPGRSWTAQIIGAVPGWLNAGAGDAVKRGIDRMGNFLHNTMLWDRVSDLQFGLAKSIEGHLTKDKGYDSDTAAYIAAHWANRLAGTLRAEQMSSFARKIANVMLFSRTYTLGNLGVVKDVVGGLPWDVQAAIKEEGGAKALQQATSYSRRKAASTLGVDIALRMAMSSVLGSAFAYWALDQDKEQIIQGYIDRAKNLATRIQQNPWLLASPLEDAESLTPEAENEIDPATGQPLKRVLIGYEKNGTAVYMRNPIGKFAEEIELWKQAPGQTLLSKLNPLLVKPTLDVLAAGQTGGVYDQFNHRLYSSTDPVQVRMAKVVGHYMAATLPMDQLQAGAGVAANALPSGAKDAVNGALGTVGAGLPDATNADTRKLVGRALGLTFRQGYPGGPILGLEKSVQRRAMEQKDEAMPGIIKQIRGGDVQGARKAMTVLGIKPRQQMAIVRSTLHPQRGAQYYFNKFATPEERARLQQLRGSQP